MIQFDEMRALFRELSDQPSCNGADGPFPNNKTKLYQLYVNDFLLQYLYYYKTLFGPHVSIKVMHCYPINDHSYNSYI